jgi:Ser/Thr protein kinase RdoA (MazF antagonist)
VSYDDLIRATLRSAWHLAPDEIAVLPAGLMSRAWAVGVGGERFVARLVDHSARLPLEAGLAAAERLRARGIVIGEPLRTLGGGLTAETPAGTLSLLRRMPGRPLAAADPLDQQWWGDRLGAAHRALDGFDHPGLRRWNWLHPEAAHLAVEPWLRAAVADAVAAMTRLTVTDRLTYGVLHGDPAAEGFLLDPATGRAGLVDWGACGTGPLVYDVAAAVVYAGGLASAAELLDGYAGAGVVDRDEVDAALPVLLRFRWAVQADWFARRLSAAHAAGPKVVDRPDAAAPPGQRPPPDQHAPDQQAVDQQGADQAALRRAREALEAMAGDCPG